MATNVRAWLQETMRADDALRAEYEALEPRFAAIREVIRAREEAGLTQTELAHRLGVSPGVISRLESGQVSPRIDTLAKAATALGYELQVHMRTRQMKRRRSPATKT